MEAEATGPQRRRASTACRFCRKRKLRCDNGVPACGNCRSYQQDCIYARGPKLNRKRPTNSRITELEEENARLKQRLIEPEHTPERRLSLQSQHAPRPDRSASATPTPHGTAQPAVDKSQGPQVQQSAVSRLVVAPNGDSSYHGVTSTLYGDTSNDNRPVAQVSSDPKMPTEWVTRGLIAEAAQQRQLETVNFHRDRLDFDGVDPELGMHLLSLHWNRQHHSFLVTYRPAFMRDMACGGPYFSKLLLNAIYFASSKFSNRLDVRRDPDDVRTAGWIFRRRVKELLGDALDRSRITTIQALLVMTSSLFALGDERSAAWLYAGTAFRMIIDLGMHVDATRLGNMRSLSNEDLEIRRRVFWAAFVVDKIQSLYQGRPATLQHSDAQVPLTFLDQFEELEHWRPFAYSENGNYKGSPAYSVSTFTELCRLSIILNEVLNKVYSESSATAAAEELIAKLNALHSDLQHWYKGLPPHLDFDPDSTAEAPPPHVLSLMAMHQVLLILLHRPFVADGHLHVADPSIAVKSFTICATAARRIVSIVRVYDRIFSIRRAPYLISYATYVAATILVRIAAQREEKSEAHLGLRTCLSVFAENQETNWAVRRANNVILHLMELMDVSLDPSPDGSAAPGRISENPSGMHGFPPENVSASSSSSTDATSWRQAEELNMRMIIQSFGRDQPAAYVSNPVPADSRDGLPSARWGDVGRPMDADISDAAFSPSHLGAFGMQAWDDMLFGFNSASLDGFSEPPLT